MSAEPLRYRDAPGRRAAIIERLRVSGYMTIREVAGLLGVSEMTARRDVKRLAQDGEVIGVRGGLRLLVGDGQQASEYARRLAADTDAKALLATAAVAGVRPDDVIAIDAGTTAYHLADALPPEFEGTVVTHSVPVIDLLMDRPRATAIALGGDVFRPSRALVGSATIAMARGLRVRTFYLGAAAVDERGVYAAADVERNVKHTLMDIADRVVLLIDHHKFSATAPVRLCDWDRLDAVATDQAPPTAITNLLAHKKIELLLPNAIPMGNPRSGTTSFS